MNEGFPGKRDLKTYSSRNFNVIPEVSVRKKGHEMNHGFFSTDVCICGGKSRISDKGSG